MDKIKLSCPCHFGLESVLSFEIKKMGIQEVEVSDGRVSFFGTLNDIAKANIWLRTAERVQIILGEFEAVTFEELFQGVKALELERFIGKKDKFPVKGYSLNSQLHSVPDCQAIIKKAAVNRLSQKYHIEWFEETGELVQIQFSILKNKVTIMLDTSGIGLHKRGYRRNSNEAPIKETLAAGIVDLARVRENSIVYDPFCGSGTFLIEAAMHALNIAPGINRRFAAEKWAVIDPQIWKDERQNALGAVKKTAQFRAYGSDIDEESVRLTLENAKKAGVASRIRVSKADVRNFMADEPGIVFSNPPYGERMLEVREAEKLYTVMGEVYRSQPENKYYIISPHEEFEHFYGKKADKRRKLYNGMMKCQLFMYFK